MLKAVLLGALALSISAGRTEAEIGRLPADQAPMSVVYLVGSQLYQLCEANMENCEMYVAGILDGVNQVTDAFMSSPDNRNISHAFCLPHGLTLRSATGVVLKYLDANGKDLPYAAAGLAILALEEAYPCPK